MSGRNGVAVAGSVALVLAVLVSPGTTRGDTNPATLPRWSSPHGPEGGPALSLAVAPSSPRIVYVGTWTRGVFRSVNGGRSWASAGLVQPPGPDGSSPAGATSLVVDPRSSSTVYAGLNGRWEGGTTYRRPIYKTTNGGRSWRAVGLHGQPVAISPTGHPTVYAATGRLGGASRLFRSTDGGGSWQKADRGLPGTYLWSLAIDPASPATLYAATGEHGLFESDDRGATWHRLGVPRAAREVTAVAVDPQHPQIVYAGTDAGVVKSVDGGRSWGLVNGAMGGHDRDRGYGQVSAFAVDPLDSQTVYANTRCTGVYRSTDGGRTWHPANRGLAPKCSRVLSLALDPSAPRTLYAADSERGVFKSLDGGAGWRAANTGLSLSTVFSLAADPTTPRVVYAGTAGLGLFKSVDGGADWRVLPSAPKLVDGLAVDPGNPRDVLAVASGYGIVRSSDGGRTWAGTRFGDAAPRADVVAISGRTAYAGTGGRGIFGSADGGRSWRELGALAALGVKHVGTLAIAPGNAAVVYAGSGFGPAPGLYRSTDGGTSWEPLAHTGVGAIALDPTDPATIYLGGEGVSRSVDGGASWQPASAGLPRGRYRSRDSGKWTTYLFAVNDLVIDPVRPATLYAAVFGHGVFRSTDSGRSWHSLDTGLSVRDVRTLALDASGRTLYAGTSGGGVVTRSV